MGAPGRRDEPLNLKLIEKLRKQIDDVAAAGLDVRANADATTALGDLVIKHADEIIAALKRPVPIVGPAEVEAIGKIVYHHFYPGPLSGSTERLAAALIDALPQLQGHEP